MSAWIISLFFAVGVSTWVYTKFMRKSGNNSQSSLIATSVIGVVAFIAMMIILSMITSALTK